MTGMAASKRDSRPSGTGGGGRDRNRAASASEEGSGLGDGSACMIGCLLVQQASQAVQGLGGTPLQRADRFLEHGGHVTITKAVQVMEYEQGSFRPGECVQGSIQTPALLIG